MIKTHLLLNFKIMAAKSFLVFTVVVLISASTAISQPPIRRENPPLTSWILSSTKDSVTVCFTYVVPFPRIIFTKTQGTPEKFEANLAFSIDAVDSITGTNHHKFHLKKIFADNFAQTLAPKEIVEDFMTMTLPKSTYKVTAEVRDDNQQITYMNETVTKRFSHLNTAGILSTIFLDSLSGKVIFPVLMNDIAPFPNNIRVALLVEDTGSVPLTLSLKTKSGASIYKLDSLYPSKVKLEPSDSICVLSFSEAPDSSCSLYIARFEIDTLQEGTYDLDASLNGKSEKLDFSYLWLDKPFTLRNFALALSLLKYIASDSVYSLINSGSHKEMREKFDAYWKSHDPTPKTAFNELEAEFYERADYAFEHFRTIATNNGAATDRGKAYIVFGKPANVKREFRSDGTYEIWYYPNLKRSLIFKEHRFGEFKLYQTEKL
ncbi:MAG: GWxTD domain-containing protein [Bacteroidetes bacterium]|nr:GWxTD domain-containing protein [Bacteroidota bacterium]MCL5738935.1 GWxTD domain-containing protein [Bacteroidota bacterium]